MKCTTIISAISLGVALIIANVSILAQDKSATTSAISVPAQTMTEIALPNGAGIRPQSLQISSDGAIALYMANGPTSPDNPAPSVSCHLFDLKNNKELDFSGAIPKAARGQLSVDGKMALIVSRQEGKSQLYLLETATLKARKLAEGASLQPQWMGTTIVVGQMDEDQKMPPIKVGDPKDGKLSESPCKGTVLGASSNGQIAIVAVASDSPAGAGEAAISLVAMDAKWQKVGVLLEKISKMSSSPCVSPSGKYIAFQIRGDGEKKGGVLVISSDGKDKRVVEDFALPLSVTDSGDLIAIKASFTPGAKIWMGKKGVAEQIELAQNAKDGTVVGDKIYYVDVSDSKGGILKTLSLPK